MCGCRRGESQAKHFKGQNKAKLEFLDGWRGMKLKTVTERIFFEQHNVKMNIKKSQKGFCQWANHFFSLKSRDSCYYGLLTENQLSSSIQLF